MARFRKPGPVGLDGNSGEIDKGTSALTCMHSPRPLGMTEELPVPTSSGRKTAPELTLSENAFNLLKQIETLRLQPYDDQTGRTITVWTNGATIGYGHLIKSTEWNVYKNGFSAADANALFEQDLLPFVSSVQETITAGLKQNEFDALVILAFNIGSGKDGFAGSSVAKLVNDPNAATKYTTLEAAWKAWNKSQGKVMKGLESRRNCEWKIYSQGIYERW